MCPVVFFDALRVKIREDAVVRNKAVYLALGVAADGSRDILGLWIEGTEGAKFWMKVFNDLKIRGHFPNDKAATKLLWLALRNITAKWGRPANLLENRHEPICYPLCRTLNTVVEFIARSQLLKSPHSILICFSVPDFLSI